jgi:Fur family transcriptional regulator, zinc uptake regulator
MSGSEAVIGILKEKGLRRTPLRAAILETFLESPAPISVPELQAKLATAGFSPNKTSLYREVEALIANQVAEETTLAGIRKVYVAPSGHHHHFVCTSCKDTYCVDDQSLETALVAAMDALADRGLETTGHDLTFYGRCESCVQAINQAR